MRHGDVSRLGAYDWHPDAAYARGGRGRKCVAFRRRRARSLARGGAAREHGEEHVRGRAKAHQAKLSAIGSAVIPIHKVLPIAQLGMDDANIAQGAVVASRLLCGLVQQLKDKQAKKDSAKFDKLRTQREKRLLLQRAKAVA